MSRSFSRKKVADRFILFLPASLIFALAIMAYAGQALIRVNAEVDKSIITIGDRITYTLTIQHEKSLRIEQPGPGANLGQFEIKDYKIGEPLEEGGNITQKFEYQISVFDTGRFVIPPFPVAFSSSDTSKKYQIIQSEPIEIKVKSVLTSEDAEIRDIKAPQPIPFNYRKWTLFSVAGLLVLIAVGLAIYIIRQRKKGVPLFRREVIRPAHEIALEELEILKSNWQQMLENGEHKKLFEQLSDILRRYLENRYFIKATEETTSEIRMSLEEASIETEPQEKAGKVLDFSDMVKFAKYIPQAAETENMIDLTEEFILETKLIFEPVEQQVEVTETDKELEPLPENESGVTG